MITDRCITRYLSSTWRVTTESRNLYIRKYLDDLTYMFGMIVQKVPSFSRIRDIFYQDSPLVIKTSYIHLFKQGCAFRQMICVVVSQKLAVQ